jgi:hypothetical protein
MSAPATQMRDDPLFVLIPSPLLGPYSWSLVARELVDRGWEALISRDLPGTLRRKPAWILTVDGAEAGLRDVAADRPVVLVGHSAAGPLLPAIGNAVRQLVGAYLFVDARLPSPGVSRLDAIALDDPVVADGRRADLDAGHRFPAWTDEDLGELVPDPDRRRAVLAELRPRTAEFWTEPLPEIGGWPNAPCGYLLFSAPYQAAADRARRAGWPVAHLSAGHFHQLVDPSAVANALVDLLASIAPSIADSAARGQSAEHAAPAQ